MFVQRTQPHLTCGYPKVLLRVAEAYLYQHIAERDARTERPAKLYDTIATSQSPKTGSLVSNLLAADAFGHRDSQKSGEWLSSNTMNRSSDSCVHSVCIGNVYVQLPIDTFW